MNLRRMMLNQTILGYFIKSNNPFLEQVWQRISKIAPKYGFLLRDIESHREIISNIIPKALQTATESWLVLYREDRSDELLVLPYLDNDAMHLYKNINNSLEAYIDKTFSILRGDIENSWFCERGYSNLRRNRISHNLDKIHIYRFQIVQTNSDINSLINSLIHYKDSRLAQTVKVLKNATENVTEQRRQILSLALFTDNFQKREELFSEFENMLLNQNFELSNKIKEIEWIALDKPEIVFEYDKVLEDNSKQFLISSYIVQISIESCPIEYFDYSLPACGLWKTIELELNIILDLIKYKKMFPNLMLKDLKLTFLGGYKNGIYEKIKDVISGDEITYLIRSHDRKISDKNTLPLFIDELKNLRNPYAHVAPMPKEKFYELRSLILSQPNDSKISELTKILKIKQKILEQMTHV